MPSKLLLCLALLVPLTAQACDGFVSMVAGAVRRYQAAHRVYPVPDDLRRLAVAHLPRLWVHPDSWQPIDFDDYLKKATLYVREDGRLVRRQPDVAYLDSLPLEVQCERYLEAPPVAPSRPAPVYIQVYRDASPVDDAREWTYIKYNLAFDWSGLAYHTGWLPRLAAFLSGGDARRWHRLDIHVSAILAFDERRRLRLVSLAQHNYQRTYLAGRDFPPAAPIQLVAAVGSNELYLDRGEDRPVDHRVVPYYGDLPYLIDGDQRPWLWAMDRTYGRKAGGREVPLRPVFIQPRHPLADFAGYLAPPRRLLGFYIGRDGPPGFDYYAPPADVPLRRLVAMGYWQEGDRELVASLQPLLKGWKDTDWEAVYLLMRGRLAHDLRP